MSGPVSKILAPLSISNHPEQMIGDGTQLSRVPVLCDNAAVRNALDATIRVASVTFVLQVDTNQWWKLGAGPTWTGTDADWTAIPPPGGSASPTGTGFTHVTGGSTDGAARAVNLATADVTGTLPLASEGAPTGTGFPHTTAGAWDSASRAVNLATADVTGALPLANQAAPTGTGFAHVTSGATDSAARAVNLATADVTGTLPAGNQAAQTMAGDVTGTTAASVVGKINGATVPAAGALTTGAVLRVTGPSATGYGPVDLANASAVTGQLPASNLTTALASPPAIGGTAAAAVKATTLTATTSLQGAGSTDDFNASGSTLTILDTEVVTASGTKSVVRNGSRPAAATLTDNSTWVEIATIAAAVLANNTGHDFLLKLLAVDFSTSTNTQVSGDIATLWIEFLITVSNSGTITLSSGSTNTTTTLTLMPLSGSVLSTIGGTTGTANPLNGLRARVSSGTVVIEAQGAPSKFYKIAATPQSITRIF